MTRKKPIMDEGQEKTSDTSNPVCARIRLTLCREERFFGPGICELLENIQKTGSIQAACKIMKMSYTKAWKILNRAEKEMGRTLITRVNGGKNGGSSTLTEEGRRAVCDYRKMEAVLSKAASELFREYERSFLPEDDSETKVSQAEEIRF